MRPLALALPVAVALAGCVTSTSYDSPYAPGPTASARLQPASSSSVSGSVMFTQLGDKVFVTATLKGLKPNAEHGFHVHEKGDCSAGDGMSAGGHFNPASKPHGDHRAGGERHAGDMPNVKADASGNAVAKFETSALSVGSGPADVVGRGLVVHRDPDDYKSQPAGNAGPRIACAVIQRS